MKCARILIVAFALLQSWTVFAQQVFQFHSNGVFGNGIACGSSVCIPTILVDVSTATTATGAQAFLVYHVFNFLTGVDMQGFGVIPAAAVTAHDAEQLILNVDTSTVPNYSNSICDPVTGCVRTAGGTVNVTIQRFNFIKTIQTSTSTSNSPFLTVHSTGTSESTSATMTGSVLGNSIVEVPQPPLGQIGMNHNVFITVQKQ